MVIFNSFDLERGTRQGCPISPVLFAIFIEALSQGIIQDINLTSVKILGQEYKISLFANDVLIYMSDPESPIPKLWLVLDSFSAVSDYKLNILKTQILSLNYRPSHAIKSNFQLNWNLDQVKYLRVIIPKDLTNLYASNFNLLNKKIKEGIKRWNAIPFLSFESWIESVKINILPRILSLSRLSQMKYSMHNSMNGTD